MANYELFVRGDRFSDQTRLFIQEQWKKLVKIRKNWQSGQRIGKDLKK